MKKIAFVILLILLCVLVVACDSSQTHDRTSEPSHVCSFGEWITTKETKCTENGQQERTCACGEKETQGIAMLDHAFGEWRTVIEAKCEENGLSQRFCSACNYTESKSIEMTGHTEVSDSAVAPTCAETGLTEGKHCSVCKTVLVAQETVWAIPHTEVVDAAVAPTCTETGLTEGKHCSICKTVLVAQETVAVFHKYDDENTCSVCGDYKDKGVVFTLIDNEYSVTDYTGNAEEVIIPSTYNGKSVTSIGDNAFNVGIRGNDSLKSITIPDSVQRIGYYAFIFCYNLESVYYSGSVLAWDHIEKAECWDANGIIYGSKPIANMFNVYCLDGHLQAGGYICDW